MGRDLSHWLIEDDNQGDWPPSEDEEFNHNELGPEGYEPYDDEYSYEALIP
jgi:hypothetical protein